MLRQTTNNKQHPKNRAIQIFFVELFFVLVEIWSLAIFTKKVAAQENISGSTQDAAVAAFIKSVPIPVMLAPRTHIQNWLCQQTSLQ